jgi:hypothetical protein
MTSWRRWPLRAAAFPFAVLWLALRLIRVPLNLLMWATGAALEFILLDGHFPGPPGWPALWGGWI